MGCDSLNTDLNTAEAEKLLTIIILQLDSKIFAKIQFMKCEQN